MQHINLMKLEFDFVGPACGGLKASEPADHIIYAPRPEVGKAFGQGSVYCH